jgi:hypothetical protein
MIFALASAGGADRRNEMHVQSASAATIEVDLPGRPSRSWTLALLVIGIAVGGMGMFAARSGQVTAGVARLSRNAVSAGVAHVQALVPALLRAVHRTSAPAASAPAASAPAAGASSVTPAPAALDAPIELASLAAPAPAPPVVNVADLAPVRSAAAQRDGAEKRPSSRTPKRHTRAPRVRTHARGSDDEEAEAAVKLATEQLAASKL